MVYFNGINLSNYIEITDIKREIMPEQIVELDTATGIMGSYINSIKLGSRKFGVEFYIKEATKEEIRSKMRDLASILHTKNTVDMWFEDEPNLKYKAIFTGTSDIEEVATYGNGILNFIAPQGIAYGNSVMDDIDIGSIKSVFTRDSQGYDGYGNIVETHMPKFNESKDGKGLLIEDAITNTLPNSLTLEGCEFEIKNTEIQNTKILDGVLHYDFTKKASSDIRFHLPSVEIIKDIPYILSFNLHHELGTIKILVESSATDNFSSGKEIGTIGADGEFTGVYGTRLAYKESLGNGWYRYYISLPDSFFGGSGTTCNIEHQHSWSYAGDIKYQYEKPMLYAGTRIRNYTPIDMVDDRFVLDLDTLQVGGCMEHQFLIDAKSIPSIDTNYRYYLWTIQNAYEEAVFSCYLFREKIYFENANSDVISFDVTEGWHTIGIKFATNKVDVVYDNVKGDRSIVVTMQDIQKLNIGRTTDWESVCTVHDTLRLSNATKTVEDMMATNNPTLEIEANTIELLKFTDNLDSSMPKDNSVLKFDVKGTLPTYPIITLNLSKTTDSLSVYHNGIIAMTIKHTLKSGDVIIINNETNNITINGENGLKYINLDSSFIEFDPKEHTISIDEGMTASIKVEYIERWI